MSNTDEVARYRGEIERLHSFFEAWFNGAVPGDEASLATFSEALDPGFMMVMPDGRQVERTELIDSVRWARDQWKALPEPGRVWIREPRLRLRHEGVALLTYQEWQQTDGEPRGRLSTVLFRDDPSTPGGLAWCHVHEVWLDC